MMLDRRTLVLAGLAAGLVGAHPALAALRPRGGEGWIDVRHFGAKGDGRTIDTPAINRAIDHVAERGGGTVYFPPGTYACFTIRLKSRITLHLENGATILAAAPGESKGYDLAEPNPWDQYQDFGHSHWRNSLIWGENLHDIAIEGQGLIWGKGLGRGDGKDDWLKDPNGPGTGNKAIALKSCRNVTLRDFKLLEGGWFALLATGVDNLTIDNILCDTNRDGFDIDCCRNVRVTNCTVNSPYDDAICPKSSYALGEARITENVMIANCLVTGNYQIGSVLDGSWRKMPADFAPLIHGRIKFGTETNGGFRNITISNCTFEDSRGLAFQTVDGGVVEDVTVSNITMRGIVNAPIFLRLGRRMRGPPGRPIGTMRRILIQNVSSSGANPLPSVIAGLGGHPIEDLKLSDLHLHHVGGAPAAMAALRPEENELGYPEATMFGDLPATGFFIRHARGVELSNVEIAVARPDPRPALHLDDVADIDLFRVGVPAGARAVTMRNVTNLRSFGCRTITDRTIPGPTNGRL
ncbi:glycoside hydrolase family 28 protein [Sphingosinicella sp. BN140058]|uniref:rhamnogalacturonidase n=1 Tax=Sphingosinicella sp. BN140058 TaxID=1892855 RepID=UPI001012D462|nr:glycoside hydrolase family 28 protein [Sphingosinicella sp. BN140058]QAY77067.1 glycoside hydrolase family 28 protein [Sphingosinicella sp. BN140058]